MCEVKVIETKVADTERKRYYFTCSECGNNGKHYDQKDVAIIEAGYHKQVCRGAEDDYDV